MAGDGQLPLFLLEVVLLPGAKLPLHIFEERYRLMVGNAAEQRSEFGVILGQEEKIASVGCTAVVEQVTHRYEDGRFDVETVGRRRFTTVSLDKSQPCWSAEVEYFEDDQRDPADLETLQQVSQLAQQIAEQLNLSLPSETDLSPFQPSFQLAGALPLDLDFKQSLLAQRSEKERLAALTDHLAEVAERLRKVRRAQRLAGTNGHTR